MEGDIHSNMDSYDKIVAPRQSPWSCACWVIQNALSRDWMAENPPCLHMMGGKY